MKKMDTPIDSVTIVFMADEVHVKHQFPMRLIELYPNSSIALGWRDYPSQEVMLQDMTADEYINMLAVLMGKKPLSECDERITHLLDVNGFVGKLEYMFAATFKRQEQDFINRLRPFHTRVTPIHLCKSEVDYLSCKSTFKDDASIVPIQVITIGNHLMFCSTECGIPLIVIKKQHTNPKSRACCIPILMFDSALDLLGKSVSYCRTIGEGIDPSTVIKHDRNCEGNLMPECINGTCDCAGHTVRCEHEPMECCADGTPKNNHILGNRGRAILASDGPDCEYCGGSACDCIPRVHKECLLRLNSTNEVEYCNSMFDLTIAGAAKAGISYTYPKVILTSLLTEAEKMVVRTVVCAYNWSVQPCVRTITLAGCTQVFKLDMYLGFVRI